ncbi:MAG: RDD family protein [Planctomycetota bacterium]|jgi:uncharacterized RDD family membrane protein YckC
MDWYYAVGDQQVGPISKAELQALVKAKKINAQTRVWRTGMKEWQELGRLLKANQTLPAAIRPGSGRSRQAQCNECGNSISQDDMIRFGDSWVCAACKPLFVQKIKEGLAVAGTMDYAGFWIRFGAKFIDWIIIGIVSFIIAMPLGYFSITTASSSSSVFTAVLLQILNYAIPACYVTFFLGKYGATPGKMACKLKVVTAGNDRVSYPKAFGRYFAEILSGLILLIGYIMAAFDDQKRTLHDRICDTRVIRQS